MDIAQKDRKTRLNVIEFTPQNTIRIWSLAMERGPFQRQDCHQTTLLKTNTFLLLFIEVAGFFASTIAFVLKLATKPSHP